VQRSSLSAALFLLIAAPISLSAQSTGSTTSGSTTSASPADSSTTSNSQSGNSTASSSQSGSSSSSQSRNAQDDIGDVAPPFDVEDVLRMHRVGLQDEVIINALRARYHPLKLSASERNELVKNSVSEAVIEAIEDPLGDAADRGSMPPIGKGGHPVLPASPAVVGNPVVGPPPAPVSVEYAKSSSAGAVTGSPAVKAAGGDSPLLLPTTKVPSSISARDGADYTRTKETAKTPVTPGVYRRISGGGWVSVVSEGIKWQHDELDSSKAVKGNLEGWVCITTTTSAGADFLIVTSPDMSIVQFQLLNVRPDRHGRQFSPSSDGSVFGGDGSSEVIPYNPQKLGPETWLVELHNLPSGDYGFLPPNQRNLRSSTGYSKEIYTFHIL